MFHHEEFFKLMKKVAWQSLFDHSVILPRDSDPEYYEMDRKSLVEKSKWRPIPFSSIDEVVFHLVYYPDGGIDRWGSVLIVEVQYSPSGARAVYGIARDGSLSCYAD